MKLSFSTIGCPAYSWVDIYPMAKDLGFDGIEVRGVAGRKGLDEENQDGNAEQDRYHHQDTLDYVFTHSCPPFLR